VVQVPKFGIHGFGFMMYFKGANFIDMRLKVAFSEKKKMK
jgi:hypothetical protein